MPNGNIFHYLLFNKQYSIPIKYILRCYGNIYLFLLFFGGKGWLSRSELPLRTLMIKT